MLHEKRSICDFKNSEFYSAVATQWWSSYVFVFSKSDKLMSYIVPHKKIYYIHIPKAGGTSEYFNLIDTFGTSKVQEVPEGKHSPYNRRYESYGTKYAHVRNPHNRMLSMFLFHHELQFMLDKYISTERQEFMKKHHKLRISRDATKINTEQTPFDRMMETKGQMFTQITTPENYIMWLEVVGKANKMMDSQFAYRPYLQQNLYLNDDVSVRKIEDEETHKNITTKPDDYKERDYLDAGKDLVEIYYKEDFDKFGYENV